MESDDSQLITDPFLLRLIELNIERMQFFPTNSRAIGRALKPYLDTVTPQSHPELLRLMDFFYGKMIEFAPYMSLGYMAKGQFHCKTHQFNKAAECFKGAYEVERDPTRKKWPHLQPTERSGQLMVWFGYALYHSGEVDEGTRFFYQGHKMVKKFKPAEAMATPLPPAEPS